MTKKLLTVEEVAETLRLQPRTVYRMAKDHKLTFIRVGGQLRFPADAFEAYLEAGTIAAVPR